MKSMLPEGWMKETSGMTGAKLTARLTASLPILAEGLNYAVMYTKSHGETPLFGYVERVFPETNELVFSAKLLDQKRIHVSEITRFGTANVFPGRFRGCDFHLENDVSIMRPIFESDSLAEIRFKFNLFADKRVLVCGRHVPGFVGRTKIKVQDVLFLGDASADAAVLSREDHRRYCMALLKGGFVEDLKAALGAVVGLAASASAAPESKARAEFLWDLATNALREVHEPTDAVLACVQCLGLDVNYVHKAGEEGYRTETTLLREVCGNHRLRMHSDATDLCARLLELKANVDLPLEHTPLSAALLYDPEVQSRTDGKLVGLLLKAGAKFQNIHARSLMCAFRDSGRAVDLRLLLDAGLDPNMKPVTWSPSNLLGFAMTDNDEHAVERALLVLSRPNLQGVKDKNSTGSNRLSLTNSRAVIKRLLELGVDPHAHNALGLTAMQEHRNNVAVTQYFIEGGYSKVCDYDISSFGICYNPKYLQQYIQEQKLDNNSKELNVPIKGFGGTIVEYVALFSHEPQARHDSLKILLESKANVHARSGEDGWTALHWVFYHPGTNVGGTTFKTIQLLLAHGAKPILDTRQRTPLMVMLSNKEENKSGLHKERLMHGLLNEFCGIEAAFYGAANKHVFRQRLNLYKKHMDLDPSPAWPFDAIAAFWRDMPLRTVEEDAASGAASAKATAAALASQSAVEARCTAEAAETKDVDMVREQEEPRATVQQKLLAMLGEEVHNRLFVQYYGLARGSAAESGGGSTLWHQIVPVVAWYNEQGNKEKLDALCDANPADEDVVFIREFKEMWIDAPRHEQERACDIACSMNTGAMYSMAGGRMSTQGGLYRSWKSGYKPSAETMRRAEEPCIIC